MILILIFSIIGFFTLLDDNIWGGKDFFSAFIGSSLGALFGLMIAVFGGIFCSTHLEIYKTQPIVSLKDNQGISGQFYLFGGQINSEPVYYYMRKENGGKVLDSINADMVTVYEDNNETPRLDEFMSIPDSEIALWFFIPINNHTYKVYIPEGSINNGYEIDLK